MPEDTTRIGQIVTQIKQTRQRKDVLHEQKGKFDKTAEDTRRETKLVREKIENLKAKLQESTKARQQVELARKIQSVVREYERKLQTRKLHELEQHTTEMYSRLARKNDFVGGIKRFEFD